MQYTKIYNDIIERSKLRKLDGYKEKHHIVPKSLGGTDDKGNIAILTAKEHFICHLLLTKIYKSDVVKYRKCIKAFMMMLCDNEKHQRYKTSKVYASLREDFSRIQSELQRGKGNSQYGTMWIHSIELKQSKRISKTDDIPEGWKRGRVLKFDFPKKKRKAKLDNYSNRQISNESIRLEKVELYRSLYKIYEMFGFSGVVERTGYNRTQSTLSIQFRKYLPEFVPHKRIINHKQISDV